MSDVAREAPRATLGIVVLCRNRLEPLQRLLESIEAQTSPPAQVIVSDDSDDAIRPSVRALSRASGGLIEYIEGPRRGLGANENSATTRLLCDYAVFLGDDASLPRDFIERLTRLLESATHRVLPTGWERLPIGAAVPCDLDFFGYQKVRHADYRKAFAAKTMVVQTTPLPVSELRTCQWLEASRYGNDEVDMAFKLRLRGWSFRFEPALWLHHERSPLGREGYDSEMQVARLYLGLKRYHRYEPSAWRYIAFFFLAPLQLVAASARRGQWISMRRASRLVLRAYALHWKRRDVDVWSW